MNTAIIDADEVLADVDVDAARADLDAEVAAAIELAVEYLPDGADYDVDRPGIIDAVREVLL